MSVSGRAAIGSLVGAALAAFAAPWLRPLFAVPSGGIGMVTVNAYPKSWDYAVIALLAFGAFAGGAIATWRATQPVAIDVRGAHGSVQFAVAVVVFAFMFLMHDHPNAPMDTFHEGEHLTPAYLFTHGERPFRDVFVLHGLGVDGGLDALVGGNPATTRRLQAVLDAATLALLVPIAAEVTASTSAMLFAVIASLCASAALWVPVFPYFRIAPVLLATLGLLRYARTKRAAPLFLACASATLGILWSLDTGLYALAGVAAALVLMRAFQPRVALIFAIAVALPCLVLLAIRADAGRFIRDSFVIIPAAIDSVWALPAPQPFTAAGARYFLPPIFYGFLLALAWRRRDPRMLIVAMLSLMLFRTAAGRVSWSHTRFATPLLGIALVAFMLEPLWRDKKRVIAVIVALPLIFYLEIGQNFAAGAKLLAGWRGRQQPIPAAPDVAALKEFLDSVGPGALLDFSNERALYALVERKPPMRCFDVPMLSAPPLLAEAMGELNANPPVAVIVRGDPNIANFDGVGNATRVPDLASWIDANYPKRTDVGRFTVATR
jgi:hypothetical protein